MEVYGVIYVLIDGTNDKEYIGQTVRTVEERFEGHKRCKKSYLGNAIRAHGAELFTWAILKVCYSKEELDYWERYMIKSRDTKRPNGYNLTDGGEGVSGHVDSPETRAKKSASHIGLPKSPETCAKLSAIHKGKKPSAETRAKLSIALSGENHPNHGKHHSNETRAKMSASQIGHDVSNETALKIAIRNRGDTPFKNLLTELDARQITYRGFAVLLNLSQATISEKMTGRKSFT